MKLLIDANLSYRLVKRINHLFQATLHVERTGLPIPASDLEIWEWAVQNSYILLLTRDEDFVQIAAQKGFPPKIVMLRIQNRSTEYVASLLERHYEEIQNLVSSPDEGILEIFERF
jgi:predicted nuclease of predicted toxin-antitoxin system